MKIGLIDVDSHNFPNLPLMKISTYHKNNGDHVEFYNECNKYDKVYISKIFTESEKPRINGDFEIIKGGSGYDLKNKLPSEIENQFPDYSLYPQYDYAVGWLTRGCPRVNHTFCITPKKDGCKVRKVADLKEFWNGQKRIVLLDQNILACKERKELFKQLEESNAQIEFKGGIDIRFLNEEVIEMLRKLKVKDYHFAWDDPREDLEDKFRLFKESGLKNTNQVGVYVLVNYWSNTDQDLKRVYTLRSMGYMPFVMIFDKQRYVNDRGRWLKGVENQFKHEELVHFKICQHMQRWCGNRKLIKISPDFNDYIPYKNWLIKGKSVPVCNTKQISLKEVI